MNFRGGTNTLIYCRLIHVVLAFCYTLWGFNMNKSIVKYLVLSLVAVCVFFAFPSKTAKADFYWADGMCGDNLSWRLDFDGTLTISGSGSMYDWSNENAVPWAGMRESIKIVNLNGDITSIGNYAFYGIANVSNYKLPDSLKTIGNYSFYSNYAIQRIILPEGLERIGDFAFANCGNLSSALMPDSVIYIGQYAYAYDLSLKAVYLPHSDVTVGANAFIICPAITTFFTTEEAMKYDAVKAINERYIKYYYDIIYSTDGNGTVSGKSYSYAGDTLKLDIKPNGGYIVDTAQLDYGSGKVVDFRLTNGVYEFAGMPGTRGSVTVIVNFKKAIEITQQPENYVGLEGSVAKFNVVAEGERFTYQWQLKKGKTWANLTSGGATTDTLSVKVDASKNGKIYRCIITDEDGHSVATNEVSITIKEPSIKINSQPVSFAGQEGATAKFIVAAEGEGLTYQWQLKKGSKWADLSSGGATTTTLSIKVDASKNGKIYRCLITDANGEQLSTNEVTITVKEPDIVIVTQPKSYSGPEGNTAKFTVVAEGEGLTYQWQLKKGSKWADLSSGGAKTSTMSVKVDAYKDGKVYRCVISNAAGEELATNEVSITIKEPDITINTQPVSYTGHVGTKAKFTVEATGEGLTYQWQLKKGSSWADLTSGGATTNELTIKVDASKNGKVYRCLIINDAGDQLATDEVTITVLGENDLPPVTPTSGVAGEDGPIVSNDPPEVIVPANNASAESVQETEPAQAEEPVQSPAPVETVEPAATDAPVDSIE